MQPKLVETVEEPVTAIAAGARHTLLLTQSQRAYTMGYGAFGATGTGSFENVLVPTPVAVPTGKAIKAIAAGWWHSLFVAS